MEVLFAMKKFDFKKIMILVLALIMIFSLAACNKKKGKEDPKPDPTEPSLVAEALFALLDGIDGLVAATNSVEDQLYAEATVFVKNDKGIDYEIVLGANIGADVEQELKVTVKTNSTELISLYFKGDVIYVQDRISNGSITYEDGVATITPATAQNGRGVKFPVTAGINGTVLSNEIAAFPASVAGLFADLDGSLKDMQVMGLSIADLVGMIGEITEEEEGKVMIATKKANGYDISLEINKLAALLEGFSFIDIDGMLADLGPDMAGLIDSVASLLFGGTLDDLMSGQLSNYPEILIGFEQDAAKKLTGLSLSYDFEEKEMNIAAGIKGLKIEKTAKTSSIIPSDVANYGAGTVDVSLGLSFLDKDINLKAQGRTIDDAEKGVGVEGQLALMGGGGIIGYGKIEGDGSMGSVLDFANVFEKLGISYTDPTKYVAGSCVPEIENEEGDEEEAAGFNIMTIISPIIDLLLGQNSIPKLIEDQKLSTTELFTVLANAQPIFDAFGLTIDLSADGLVDLIKEGIASYLDEEEVDDEEAIDYLNTRFALGLTGTDLETALFGANGVNITFDFPANGLGINLYVKLGNTTIVGLSLGLGFDQWQNWGAAAFAAEVEDAIVITDGSELAPIADVLLGWLLSNKTAA
jgi:uncharacterized lipoprotein YehR (DUF1307 family)